MGWEETFVGDFDTIAEARAAIKADESDTWEIVSTVKKCVVESSEQVNKLAGVPDPNRTYARGEWTTEQVLKMMNRAQEKLNKTRPEPYRDAWDYWNDPGPIKRAMEKNFREVNQKSQKQGGQELPPAIPGFQQGPIGPPPVPPDSGS